MIKYNFIKVNIICCFYLLRKGNSMKNINTNINNDTKPIKVTIHVPENVSPAVRQRKINSLYDMLKSPDLDDTECDISIQDGSV